MAFLTNETRVKSPEEIVTSLHDEQIADVHAYLVPNDRGSLDDLTRILLHKQENAPGNYNSLIENMPIPDAQKYESGFELFKHKIPMWIFLFTLVGLAVWAYRKNLSLIPLLGLICCLYMMAELSVWNWIYFTIWLLIGLAIYFGYSRRNSKLNVEANG
nr:amino acid permease C-terminal domain-containing protein [Flavobacterium sp. J372]